MISRIPDFGDPAPLFTARTDEVDAYNIGVVAGRFVLLMIFGSLGVEACARAHAQVLARRAVFDDRHALFFGVSADRADHAVRRIRNQAPGLRYFQDYDLAVSRLYGLLQGEHLRPAVFLLDPMLRVMAAEPIEATGAVLDRLEAALADQAQAEAAFAPVLGVPRILEPELCERLIAHYQQVGGEPSGFAVEVDGRTVQRVHPGLKRRRDVWITDVALRAEVRLALTERLFPMIERAWGWRATEIERDIVTCYDSADQGFFSAHRDDATAGTAHRRFAVTLNLNADAYEGGALRFPEFGSRLYKPPTGGAVVFGCSLLHEATPVTAGVRYALTPFLYDEAGARLRARNLAQVGEAA
ncbi:2OG-Fe(II) oxygenase [Caulobacter sp. S45]|uniref:2OG-Fe(II) oxygenase n=1 Tax=Caulobacter sp. S45 TaxID=1641861 RepID=UPI001575A789|nr:2OG-Fe(II) oxygenase [Caulobacter sp. S45]